MLKPFTVFGQDGELGTVDDLYFDDEKWTGRYVVVNSNRWLPGKKLFVSPASISEFTLENESLYANINKEEAKKVLPQKRSQLQGSSKASFHSITDSILTGWGRDYGDRV